MKRKILAIILTALMVLWIALPRHIENGFIVESIIDDNMGINVHYPKTGNEKLDKDIYFYISKIIIILSFHILPLFLRSSVLAAKGHELVIIC